MTSNAPTPNPNEVYEARVEMRAPDGRWITKTGNGGVNAMFPTSWDAARVQAEIDSAWEAGGPIPWRPDMWEGKSASGVTIRGFLAPRTTAHPVWEKRL